MPSMLKIFIWGIFLTLPLWAQIDLVPAKDHIPLVTQPFDYSAKAKRVIVDEETIVSNVQRIDGMTIIKRRQIFEGIPVLGGDLFDIYDGDTFVSRTGAYGHLYALNTQPILSASEAIAETSLYLDTRKATAELWIYPARGKTYLAWWIKENNVATNWNVFMDAHTGDLLDAYQGIHHGTGVGVKGDMKEVESTLQDSTYALDVTEHGVRRRTLSANNLQSTEDATPFTDSDDTWNSDYQAAAVDAHHHSGLMLDFIREKLNRNSYDDQGGEVISIVNYSQNWVNANYNGQHFIYGDGDGVNSVSFAAGLDMVGHEMGHALVQNIADLWPKYQAGIILESYADLFGMAAEYYYQPDQFDWTIGEDFWTPGIVGDALRYYANPTVDGYSSDHWGSRYTYPPNIPDVTRNIGLPNLAFYLTAEGGKHPRRAYYIDSETEVFGIGFERAFNIWYAALLTMPRNLTLWDLKNAHIAAAAALYGDEEVIAVTNAWAIVGRGDPVPNGAVNGSIFLPGYTFQNLEADTGEWERFFIDVPVGAKNLVIRTFDGAGDADLHVRYGAEPTESQYTYRPYKAGNDEIVVEANPTPGIWYIGLRGYNPFEDVKMVVDYEVEGEEVPENETLDLTNLGDETDDWQFFTVEVHSAADLLVEMSGGDGDADLYVRYQEEPTIGTFDYRPFNSGNDETVAIENAQAGVWHIGIHAYQSYSDLSLKVSYPE